MFARVAYTLERRGACGRPFVHVSIFKSSKYTLNFFERMNGLRTARRMCLAAGPQVVD